MNRAALFENFDIFADVPDAVTKMRELVLDWAVSGKLCHTDSVEWKEGVLGDVIKLFSGQHLLAHEHNEERRGIPYLTGPSDFGDKSPIPTRWTDQPKVTAEPGDILITVKGSGVGKTNVLVDQPTAISRQLMAIRVTGADPDFVHVVVKRAAEHFQNAKTGIAIPGIGRREVLGLKLTLPPLPEQKRIVAKVDELMALCDRLEAQQEERETRHAALARASLARFTDAPTPDNLNFLFHPSYAISPVALRKSILTLAVQGHLRLQPDGLGFPQVRLDSLGDWAQGCGFPLAEQGHTDRPILFSKVSDMNLPGNEREILRTNHTIDEATAKRLRIKVHPPGTVIFPKIGGAIATNKRRVLVRPTAIDNNCSGIIPNSSCSTAWVFLVLSAIDFAEYQSGTSVPAVNQGALGEIEVSLPPLAEQRRIVAKVDELMALVDALETQLATTQNVGANLIDAVVNELSNAA